jgi:mannosyltransferase
LNRTARGYDSKYQDLLFFPNHFLESNPDGKAQFCFVKGSEVTYKSNQMQFQNRVEIKLLAILVLAALLRFFGLGVKQLWSDEILQVLHSRPDSMQGILNAVTLDRGGAPLDYLIQHVFMANLSGAMEWPARFHAALFGVLAVLLIYLVCRELLADQRLSLMSALLFCFYPFHIHYSQEGRPYSLFTLWTLILYFLLFRSLKKNSVFLWGSFGASAILAFYTHAFAAIVLFGQLVFLICYQLYRRENGSAAWRRYAGFLTCSAVAATTYLPWLVLSFSNAKGEIAPEKGFRLFLDTIKRLGDGSFPLAILLIVCAAVGIHSLIQSKRRIELGALLIWMLIPFPAIMSVLLWRTYFYSPRQILFVTPAFIILAAAGVEYLKQKVSRRYFYPEAVIILMSIGVLALHYPDKRDDLRAAAHFLKENTRSADVIVAPNLTERLSLYFPDIYRCSADSRSAEDLMQKTLNGSRIIYVAQRSSLDFARLNRLLAGMPKSKEVQFRGITIYFLNGSRFPILDSRF